MSDFWIGAAFGVLLSLLNALNDILTWRGAHALLRTTMNSLPARLSAAFLSGCLVHFMRSQNNEFGNGLLLAACTLVSFFFFYCLEYNMFILNPLWRRGLSKRWWFSTVALFCASMAIALFPYVRYAAVTNVSTGVAVGSWAIAVLVYLSVLSRAVKGEEATVRGILRKQVTAYCQTSYLVTDGLNERFILRSAREDELRSIYEETCNQLNGVYRFRPYPRGEPLPGLESRILAQPDVERISEEVQVGFLSELEMLRHKLQVLTADDTGKEVSLSSLRGTLSDAEIDELLSRREDLTRGDTES